MRWAVGAAAGGGAVVVARLRERVAGRGADAGHAGAVRIEDARIVGADEVRAAAVGRGLADRLTLAVRAGEPAPAVVEPGRLAVSAGDASAPLADRAVGEADRVARGRAGGDPAAALVREAARLRERVARGRRSRVGAGVVPAGARRPAACRRRLPSRPHVRPRRRCSSRPRRRRFPRRHRRFPSRRRWRSSVPAPPPVPAAPPPWPAAAPPALPPVPFGGGTTPEPPQLAADITTRPNSDTRARARIRPDANTTAEVRRSALSRYDSGPRMRVVGLRIGLSLLAGALLFLAVPTYGLWPLMWIAAVPEIYVARVAATPKRAFLYGWLTGAVAHTGGFYWMDGLLERFGHMAPIEALPIMALLIAYQGLAFALLLLGRAAGLGPDRRAARAAGAAGHGRRRAPDAADLPLLPGDLAGVRAGGHPDRRPDRAARRHRAHAGVRAARSRTRSSPPLAAAGRPGARWRRWPC